MGYNYIMDTPLHDITSLIQDQKKSGSRQRKRLSDTAIDTFNQAVKTLETSMNEFLDHQTLIISNLNKHRYTHKEFYVLSINKWNCTLVKQFPQRTEEFKVEFKSGNIKLNGNIVSDEYYKKIAKELQSIGHDISTNQVLICRN